MAHMVSCVLRISIFALCLAALSPATAFPQASSDISSAANPIAYVYVGTTKGVYLYNAASNGSLTVVSGSPFPLPAVLSGATGNTLSAWEADYVHSYPLHRTEPSRARSPRSIRNLTLVASAGPAIKAFSTTPARKFMWSSHLLIQGRHAPRFRALKFPVPARSHFWEQQSSIRPSPRRPL